MESHKAEILKELKEKFDEAKKELGFKSSFEEVEELCQIKDAVLGAGFVSDGFSRQLCSRIVDFYASWMNYLHGILMPNTAHMVNMTEANFFNKEEKQEIAKTISEIMSIISINSEVKMTRDRKEESKFIDESVKYWQIKLKAKGSELMIKVKKGWEEQAKKPKQEQKKEYSAWG